MNWQFKYRDSYEFLIEIPVAIPIPIEFEVSALIVGIKASPRILYCGRLVQNPFIPGFGRVKAKNSSLQPDYQLCEFDSEYPYRLDFEPARKLDSIEMSIWVGYE